MQCLWVWKVEETQELKELSPLQPQPPAAPPSALMPPISLQAPDKRKSENNSILQNHDHGTKSSDGHHLHQQGKSLTWGSSAYLSLFPSTSTRKASIGGWLASLCSITISSNLAASSLADSASLTFKSFPLNIHLDHQNEHDGDHDHLHPTHQLDFLHLCQTEHSPNLLNFLIFPSF